MKHPKPLTKLKVRCYKAAIESGTWRSPFEKWPKLPHEAEAEGEDEDEDEEDEIFNLDISREGSHNFQGGREKHFIVAVIVEK